MILQAGYDCYLTQAEDMPLSERRFENQVLINSPEDVAMWKEITSKQKEQMIAEASFIDTEAIDVEELIGINDLKRDATIARNSAGANDSYYYNIIPSNVVKCSYLVEILEDRSQPKIYIVSKYYSNYKNDYNVKGVVVGSSMLSVKFFYNDNGDIILSIVASTRSSLVSVKLLCGDSMPSITKIETPSGLTEIPIS